MTAGPIDTLKQITDKRGGLSRPNRFSISIPEFTLFNLSEGLYNPDTRDIDIMCESAQMPGRQILTSDYQPTRHAEKKPNGYANEDVNLIFNLTNDYYIRDLFNKWTNFIIDRKTYAAGFRDDYSTTVYINQLDGNFKEVYSVKLNKAYPVTVQSIDLNHTSTDAIQKLSVSLTYYDFEEINHVNPPAPKPKMDTFSGQPLNFGPSNGPSSIPGRFSF
jgi:hypothetical protein